MKKHLIFAAFAAAGALMCSCQQEKDVEQQPSVNSDEVSLVMQGIATRSSEGMALVERNSYALDEEIVEGLKFSLEETVSELGSVFAEAPETRGTPAYTENVVSVYGKQFSGVIYGSNGVVAPDGDFLLMGSQVKMPFRRNLGFDPWKQANPLAFFLRMPSKQTGVTNLAYDFSAGSIEFDYETPASAANQQDILFASRKLDEATYMSESQAKGGAEVLFRHALTGVKFAIGNNDTEAGARRPADKVETFITEIEITGLKDKGHAKFVPTGEGNTDDINNFSSAKSFAWYDVAGTTNTTKYTEKFSENDIVDFKKGDDVGAADSFYDGGADNNLNKPDASKTFWFIPQAIDENLIVTVKLKVWSGKTMGEEKTLVLELGKLIKGSEKNSNWKAGQIRTFTLKPNLLDVDIHDDVDGFEKTNVVITNTGNVEAYIRANIIANWWGTNDAGDEGAALGYKPNAAGDGPLMPLEFYEGWKLVNATTDNYGGQFEGLPGQKWQLAKDGYYYYTDPVDPGKETGNKLFLSYTNTDDNIPVIYYLSTTQGYQKFTNMKFVMDIAVQAIEAKKDGESYVGYIESWANEANVTVEPVQ